MKYRPLPFYLTIKESEIHGLGLYTLAQIPKDTTIGMTHIQIENDLIRTPLGGFINHSEKPNCERKEHNNRWFLKTIKNIDKDEELTLEYSMYKP
jgi:SET domain-containing protein